MDGNHVHFSIRHTTSHYNDQSKLVGADGVTYFLDVREGGTRTDGGQDPSDLFNARLAIPVAHRDVSTSNDVYADGITGTEYPHLATDFCNSASPIAPGAGNSVTITKSVLTPKIPALPTLSSLRTPPQHGRRHRQRAVERDERDEPGAESTALRLVWSRRVQGLQL